MKVPKVEKFCGFMSLKSAGFLAFVIGIFLGIWLVFNSVSSLNNIEEKCDEFSLLTPELIPECNEKSFSLIKQISLVSLVWACLAILVSFILITGVIKEIPILLTIYIIYVLHWMIVLSMVTMTFGIVLAINLSFRASLIFLIFLVILIPLPSYFLIVLNSLKCEFEEKN